MNQVITDIIKNLELRNAMIGDQLEFNRFQNGFKLSVFEPLKKALSDANFESKLALKELNCLVQADNDLVVQKLEGFDDFLSCNQFSEKYAISAVINYGKDITLLLESKIHRCTGGDGSNIESWNLSINGVDIEDIDNVFNELEEPINDFILEHYQGCNYDVSIIDVDDQVINDFAASLGLSK